MPADLTDVVTAYLITRNIDGTLAPGVLVYISLYKPPANDAGSAFSQVILTTQSDVATGMWTYTMIRGATYKYSLDLLNWKTATIPADAATPYQLPDLL